MPLLTRLATGFAALLLAACVSTAPTERSIHAGGDDARFQRHVAELLEATWRQYPEYATAVGYYKYADQMTVPDGTQRARELAFIEAQAEGLRGFDESRLNVSNRIDLKLLRDQIEARRWYLTTFRAWQWQPSSYNIAYGFATLLNTEYASMDTRLKHVLARLEKVPAYYAAAKANIQDPTLEHTELAIQQNKGTLGVFGDELLKKVEASGLSKREKELFTERVAGAKTAINDYLAYLADLKVKLEQGGARSFRIGRELYEQKFAHDIQSGFTATELYQKALAEKARLHDEMEKLARELWPKYLPEEPMPEDRLAMIGQVIDKLSEQHAKREEFVDAVRRQIPELEAFVREKDLLDQDPKKPLVVRETPEYQRGIAGASIDAPGPYDPEANTYYNVTPLDKYTSEQAESYLREYNHWMLQILNIHEAIPGHYTQLVHSNKAKSLVKSIFGNGAMVEGWAVYGERMMLDAGYGGNTPEMWLIWMKWNLRTVCNTIIDYQIQTQGMAREETIEFLKREAFQQDAEAREKWRRATLTQVQLTSYFDGYAEIMALRDEEKARLGDRFNLKAFHNRFLSYGSAPVKYIRELMREGT
jgi:uncharacterized protein (DUF885 family)